MAQTGFDLELEQLTLSKIQDKFFGHMQSLFKKRNFQCFSMKKYGPDTNVAFSFQWPWRYTNDLGQCYDTPSGNNQSLCEVT